MALVARAQSNGIVSEGQLTSPSGYSFPISDGIPDLTFPSELPVEDSWARNTYDRVANVYDDYLPLTFATFSEDEGKVRNRMIDRLRLAVGATVLEVGGGTGRSSRLIAERIGAQGQIYFQDISPRILRVGMESLADVACPVSFSVANAVYLPFAEASFDACFHFGGINMFSDRKRALREMVRVVKPGGRVVVGDESMPPWLRTTELGRALMNSDSHYRCDLPLADLPVEARDVVIEYILGGVFYLISFTVGVGEPQARLDLPIPGARGGTHLTRLYGQLEGVTPATKRLAEAARAKRGVSMHSWLDDIIRAAAQRELDPPP